MRAYLDATQIVAEVLAEVVFDVALLVDGARRADEGGAPAAGAELLGKVGGDPKCQQKQALVRT